MAHLMESLRQHRAEILIIARQYHADNSRLFGSVARGDERLDKTSRTVSSGRCRYTTKAKPRFRQPACLPIRLVSLKEFEGLYY